MAPPPKPSTSALAVAALTSLSASAQAQEAQEAQRSVDPLSAPIPPPRQKQHRSDPKNADRPDLLPSNRTIEPFAFLGFNASWITTYIYYLFPRIAPHVGAGVRVMPDGDHSAQFEVSLDFLGGMYPYFYGPSWYTYAVTYLSFPLLARHKISTRRSKAKYFTWGLQFSQRLGESEHRNVLGLPVEIYPLSRYSYYGGSDAHFFNTRMLSLALGYQARRTTKRGGIHEFEMRLNIGLTNFGEENTEGVSGFSFRWNIVPRSKK